MKPDKSTIIKLDKEYRLIQDELETFLCDYRMAFIQVCENHDFDETKPKELLTGMAEIAVRSRMKKFIKILDERIEMNNLISDVNDILNNNDDEG